MATARRVKNERAFWRQQRRRAARARDRKQLRQLREALRDSKRLQRDRMREVVIACKRARLLVRENAKVTRAAARAAAQAAIDQERQQSRSVCELEKQRVRRDHAPNIEGALRALDAERRHQAELARWAKRKPLACSSTTKGRCSALQESDAEVEANLPQDLVGVWRAVRRRIKGTPNATRTEKFLEWASEHRAEVVQLQDRQVEREIAELVKQEKELRERYEDPNHYRRLTDAELEAVPF